MVSRQWGAGCFHGVELTAGRIAKSRVVAGAQTSHAGGIGSFTGTPDTDVPSPSAWRERFRKRLTHVWIVVVGEGLFIASSLSRARPL